MLGIDGGRITGGAAASAGATAIGAASGAAGSAIVRMSGAAASTSCIVAGSMISASMISASRISDPPMTATATGTVNRAWPLPTTVSFASWVPARSGTVTVIGMVAVRPDSLDRPTSTQG